MMKLFHIQNLASAAAGTLTVRVSVFLAQSWSLLLHHMPSPLCGSASVTTLFGRLTLMPSAVPRSGREFWPTLTSRGSSPGLIWTGSAQPRIHLSHRPMCVGMDWKIGPACEPDAIRSQKSTSESPPPEVS